MILIADSGSTKTDWTLLDTGSGLRHALHTRGINPVHQSPADVDGVLRGELLAQWPGAPQDGVRQVWFYGAGCTAEHAPLVAARLSALFGGAAVSVESDLLAAARALCQHAEGIACILGTGANSGLYDGRTIVQNTPALGYVLGDEGSGAVLGRRFLNALFKNPALAVVRDDFLQSHGLTLPDVIRRVYREPMANRFLAATSLYIAQHLDNPVLRDLVVDNFRQFLDRNVRPYGRDDLPVHCVGSMAYHYLPQLREAAEAEGMRVGTVVKSPMEGLVAYHGGR